MNRELDTRLSHRFGGALLLTATLLGATAMTSTAVASGSYGPAATSQAQSPYNQGKRIFYKKLTCKSCPLQTGKLDKNSAKMMVEKLKTDQDLMKSLTREERSSAVYYLNKRYKITGK